VGAETLSDDGRSPRSGETKPTTFEPLTEAAPHASPPQELEDHVLRCHPVRELSRELDADDFGSGSLERLSGHHEGHIKPAGPDGYGPEGAGGGRVGVRPDERRARPGEALDVQGVADAVPRSGEVDAVLGGEGLQEAVVVRVLEVQLDDVMVDVLDGEIHLCAVKAHPLELQAGHRTRSVLEERLIYPQPHFLAWFQGPFDHVILDDLGDQIFRHRPHLRFMFPNLPRLFYIPAVAPPLVPEYCHSVSPVRRYDRKIAHLGDVPSVTTLLRCTGPVSRPQGRSLEFCREKTDVQGVRTPDVVSGRLRLRSDRISGGDES
jgi:hypothetical protein